MNPLKNPWLSAGVGLVLALIIAAVFSNGNGNPSEWTVWLHVVVGVMWVGLLYYFNFVQVPAVNACVSAGDAPAAINKYVAPQALFFFRWASVLTWLTGAAALGKLGIFMEAITFSGASPNVNAIGMGAWLGTIMLINVWVFIWPNQQKLLGMKPATDEEKAKAKVTALYASRINTILSIPMLLGMTAYGHGLPF